MADFEDPITWPNQATFNNNILQADGKYIATDEVRARNGDGLKLYDDSGSNGIFVEDGGQVAFGHTTPDTLVHLKSTAPELRLEHTVDWESPILSLRGSHTSVGKIDLGIQADELDNVLNVLGMKSTPNTYIFVKGTGGAWNAGIRFALSHLTPANYGAVGVDQDDNVYFKNTSDLSGGFVFWAGGSLRISVSSVGVATFNNDINLVTGKGIIHADGVASGKVLIADGTRYVPADLPGSFSGFANPTASVGLSAVNGSATTAMRSDAAPALDQGIAPTWTANHTFNENVLQAAAKYISTAEVRAQGAAGLKLYDDGGNGVFVKDGGYVGVGTDLPGAKFEVSVDEAIDGVEVLRLNRTSDSPADWDFMDLAFRHENDNSQQPGVGTIRLVMSDVSDTTESAHFLFRTFTAGSIVPDMSVGYNGRTGVGVTLPAGQLHVDQPSTTGAIPALVLDQADIDQPIVKIIGTAEVGSADRSLVAAADFTTPGAIVAWEMVYAEDIGNRFTDGKYYRPLYATPTA
jgi:hypothetical protein